MRYEVQVNGSQQVHRTYSKTIEVNAESESNALTIAEEKAGQGGFDWGEPEDQTMDMTVGFDSAEVISEIE